MMKSRILLFMSIGLAILGVALYTFLTRNQKPVQNFPATINHDCAPWDGEAFTIQIPIYDRDIISLSIWKSPQTITTRTSFSFPDNTGQVGNASFIHPASLPEMLSGRVFLQQMNQSNRMTGSFDLMTDRGEQLKGGFTAEWTPEIALCG